MDFHMKHESELEAEQYSCAKMPKLNPHDQYYDHPSVSALPLFVPEPKISTTYNSDLSAFPDATATVSKLPRTGGSYFSLAQWQELELQALIYRYMLAGAAVPPELLQPIKKSLLLSHSYAPPYFLHHPLHHFQPALLQSGYWGRLAMDPEPGRCRRTDGKKWRCSRDVVGGHKYCERHMHRGRNRSRKPVETPTPAAAGGGGAAGTPISAISMSAPLRRTVAGENNFSLSGPSPSADLLNLSQSYAHSKHENKSLFHTQNEVTGSDRSDGHVLRHFFDDWPRPMETDGSGSNGSALNFATSLSISMPTNSSSDVSLKLSTGVGDEPGSRNGEHETQVVNWGSGWAPSSHVSSMGGPLAEALRSSTSTSSPTSVLHHQLPRNSVSDTSFVSA